MTITPSPETAATIGAMVIPFVEQNYGVTLDYAVASLERIDVIVDDLRRDQSFEAVQPLLFSLGCYVGEVFVRHARASWRTPEELGMQALASSPIVVRLPDGRGCNPVGRVYRRFQDGAAESLAHFYRASTGLDGEPA